MASNSLQSSSCMVLLATTPQHRIIISPSPKKLGGRRFPVSCSGGGGAEQKPSAGRVDRRNMLLGLGGMYGAANLFPDPDPAQADPIKAPNLLLCGQAYDLGTGDPLKGDFCPPLYSGEIESYVLPEFKTLRRRRPAHRLNRKEMAKFERAIMKMKILDSDPRDPRGFLQQANIHAAYCNSAYPQVGNMGTPISVHFSWLFYPFHRWYLYFYERILAKLLHDDGVDDSDFALPFWNYDNDNGGMRFPPLYQMPRFPALYDKNRNQDHVSGKIIDLSVDSGITDEEELKEHNLGVMYTEMIRGVSTTEAFMGQPYRAGDRVPGPTRAGTGEAGSHTSVHRWVGNPNNKYKEDMGNFYSAGRDPAFYALHANVDRLWSIWQGMESGTPKSFDDPDYLNASFLFYDENRKLVKVRVGDCFDNAKMGYEYEKVETPWRYYHRERVGGADSKKLQIKNISKGAKEYSQVFPNFTLTGITRVFVSRPNTPGKADEVLVLENISSDSSKFVKFDVYVNGDDDEDFDEEKGVRVAYAGTFAHLPHFHNHKHGGMSSMETTSMPNKLKLSLKILYDDMKIDGSTKKVVVTLIPRSKEHATIYNMRIVDNMKLHKAAADLKSGSNDISGLGLPNVGEEASEEIDTSGDDDGGPQLEE